MTDEQALLASIKADPDADLPRLVYADWLEERGKGKIAERIRRQIDNGKTFKINGLRGYQTGTASGAGNDFLVTWRRGFVDEIRCGAAWWISNGDAVLAAHPVRAVTLTTWPEIPGGTWEHTPPHVSRGPLYEIAGRKVEGPNHEEWHYPDRLPGRTNEWVAELLSRRWPGVAFELPPEQRRGMVVTAPPGWPFADVPPDFGSMREAGRRAAMEQNERFWRAFLGDAESP